jgi:hypothetical protein
MHFPTLDELMVRVLGPEEPSIHIFNARRAGPGRRSLYTIHKKAGLSRKEQNWRDAGPSMAGRTESAERM